MKKKRILKLARFLRKKKVSKHFDMDNFLGGSISYEKAYANPSLFFSCGTTACIGGWCAYQYLKSLKKKDRTPLYGKCSIEDMARNWLKLDKATAYRLFYPRLDAGIKYKDISPKQAAKVLKILEKTGKVEWQKVLTA